MTLRYSVEAIGCAVPDGKYGNTVVVGFWIASSAFLVRFINWVVSGVSIAAQRFEFVNTINITTECVPIIGSITVFYLGFGRKAGAAVLLLACPTRSARSSGRRARPVPIH
jgi:hypothetical protein